MLTLKAVYHLPQRATQGLVASLMQLMSLGLPVPHHTIMSKRAAQLEVTLPRQAKSASLHVVVDATGLKVYGEGEWKVRPAWGTRSAARGENSTSGWTRPRESSEPPFVRTRIWPSEHVLPDLLEQINEQIGQREWRRCL